MTRYFSLAMIFFALQLLQAQDATNLNVSQPQQKVSYLDSIKSTFIHDDMASCVDSLWLKELSSLELFNNITADITKFNFDEKVDYELSTDLLKERLKKLDAKSPFHIEYNPGLENLIKSFLKNRKRSFERLMAISEYYFPMFEEALAKQNVPLEIKYLAIVESALNPKAVSRVGATGLWQFMYQTGKQYNLHIDSYVDERSDPLKSSAAAAQYMNNMFRIFGDWDLVLASYNSGPGNVAKAIRRSGGRQNYWNIREYLPKETQGYVPAFLATMYIYEYHKEHGIKPEKALIKHFATDTVMVKKELSFKQLSDLLDVPVTLLQALNPSYKRDAVPAYDDKNHFLRLPQDKVALFTSNESKIYAYADYRSKLREKPYTRLANSQQEKNDSEEQPTDLVSSTKTRYHKVRRGESLTGIASKYGVSLKSLKKWNNLRSNKVATGKNLKIVTQEQVAIKEQDTKHKQAHSSPKKDEVAASTSADKKVDTQELAHEYLVQPGDNLTAIARHHNVSVEDLKTWNRLEGNSVMAGSKLYLKNPEVREEKIAEPVLKDVEYIVKKGDFLTLLAKRYNVTLEDLKTWNALSDNNLIVGQKLIVGKTAVEESNKEIAAITPKKKSASQEKKGKLHYVRKGDSLYSIAKKYPGITISDIKRWNGIKNENIKPGMKLKING